MRLQFRLVTLFILIVLVSAGIYQGYWLYSFYHEQYAKMEVDIMTSMRNADQQTVYRQSQSERDVLFLSYNNFLQSELIQKGIHVVSFTELFNLQTGEVLHTDILSIQSDADSDGFMSYVYPFDPTGVYAYRLYIKQPYIYVVKQMTGLLLTSLVLVALLFVSYFYLLKVIFRQKTLDEMKSDFVNNMTHELKTPISVAYAANDALLNYGMLSDEEKTIKYLKIAQEQLRHLGGLVEQILTMSAEDRKNLKLCKEDIRLLPLFENLKHQYSLQTGKTVEISIKVQDEGIAIQADRVHFRNVVSNLIENAIKYSGDSVHIEISAAKEVGSIRICVADNGRGIPASSLSKIFDKFYRVPSGNIHDVKGYGLGLAYVKTIVEKMGGAVSVESVPGKGSRFYIEL